MLTEEIETSLVRTDHDKLFHILEESEEKLPALIEEISSGEQGVDIAMMLRRMADFSRYLLYRFLEEWEASGKWKSLSPNGSFDGVLRNQNICISGHFRDWQMGRDKLGGNAKAKELGVEATVAAKRIKSPEALEGYAEEVGLAVEDRKVPPSRWESTRVSNKYEPPEPSSRRGRGRARLEEQLQKTRNQEKTFRARMKSAEERIAELKRENTKLKRENTKLKKRIEELTS